MLGAQPLRDLGMTASIAIEHFNYGKLALDEDGKWSVRASDSLGITRRSRGLDSAIAGALLPTSMIDIKQLHLDLIDPDARKDGFLFVRQANTPKGLKTVLMRSRFRTSGGENGEGRLYQQTASWVVDADNWQEFPAAILKLASSELKAMPDLTSQSSSERFDVKPLPCQVERDSTALALLALDSIHVLRILDVLLPQRYADSPATRCLTFGIADGLDEASFLVAVGNALQILWGTKYNYHRDIRIASGLRSDFGGLALRYIANAPSAAGEQSPNILRGNVEGRLSRFVPRARPQRIPSFSPLQAVTKTAQTHNGELSGFEAPIRQDSPAQRSAEDIKRRLHEADLLLAIGRFKGRLLEYRQEYRKLSRGYTPVERTRDISVSAVACIDSASEVYRLAGQTVSSSDDAKNLDPIERLFITSTQAATNRSFASISLGGLVDLHEILFWVDTCNAHYEVFRQVRDLILQRIAILPVLLGSELAFIKRSRHAATLYAEARLDRIRNESEGAKEFLRQLQYPSTMDIVTTSESQLCDAFEERFEEMLAVAGGAGERPVAGIHGICIANCEALITPEDFMMEATAFLRVAWPKIARSIRDAAATRR